MKKISSFLPQHVVIKRDQIFAISQHLQEILPSKLKAKVTVLSLKDNILTIVCEDSSVATLMRFEKNKYITNLNKEFSYKIDDIKVTV